MNPNVTEILTTLMLAGRATQQTTGIPEAFWDAGCSWMQLPDTGDGEADKGVCSAGPDTYEQGRIGQEHEAQGKPRLQSPGDGGVQNSERNQTYSPRPLHTHGEKKSPGGLANFQGPLPPNSRTAHLNEQEFKQEWNEGLCR